MLEALPDGNVRLLSAASLRAHEDILSWIARSRGRHGAVIAGNAPILVENTGGQRRCDALLREHFGAHHVDEYQVNTVNASHPRTIGRALMRMGFDPDPSAAGDRIVETCNQATQILLFELDRPFRLKSGPLGARKEALSRYREAIVTLLGTAEPALVRWSTTRYSDVDSPNGPELMKPLGDICCQVGPQN